MKSSSIRVQASDTQTQVAKFAEKKKAVESLISNLNSFDKTGDGYLTPEEIKQSFHTAGIKLSMKQV